MNDPKAAAAYHPQQPPGEPMSTPFEAWSHTVSSYEQPDYHDEDFDPYDPTPRIEYNGVSGVDVTIRMTFENYREHVFPYFAGNDKPLITIKENTK